MILLCYGTRPEWIKIKPLIDQLRKDSVIPFKVLFTGQHSNLIDKQFGDYNIAIESTLDGNRLDDIFCSILSKIDFVYSNCNPKYVLVQGDTATALAIAMTAFHRGIKIIHLEAGLRTHDINNPYPEEFYRQAISKIADIHLCPTEENRWNLLKEGIKRRKIFVTGNTVIDNLNPKIKIDYNNDVIITMHRRENHFNLNDWFDKFSELALQYNDLNFIIPLHPNPNVQKHKHLLKNIKIIDPVSSDQMINMIAQCRFIISDSGGIQEEANFFNKKVIVCREKTERPEALGFTSFLCPTPKELNDIFDVINLNYIPASQEHCNLFGDGEAAKRIVEILEHIYLK